MPKLGNNMKAKIIFSFLLLAASAFWLASTTAAATSADSDIDYYTCTMHPSVHSKTPGKCPICGMDLVPVYKKSASNAPSVQSEYASPATTQTGGRKIKFYQSTMNPRETSPVPAKDSMGMEMEPVYEEATPPENQPDEFVVSMERQQQIGVTYAKVAKRPLKQTLRAVGTVAIDITRQRDFIAPAAGSVMSLDISSAGETVTQGQPLFTIYSPDLLSEEQDFADAVANYKTTPKFGTRRMIGTVEAQYEAAKNRLLLWNLTTNQIAGLEEWTKRIPRDTVTIYAPFSGVVKSIGVGPGKNFGMGDQLLELTDFQTVYVWANFYQDELPLLKEGLPVDITTSSWPGETFHGTIAVIDPFLNPDTRTVRVRIDVENPDLKLRPEMFVDAELKIDLGESLAVPVNAVLPTGQHNIVFVDKGDGKLQPRFIELGQQCGDYYEVKSGLNEGERIVDSANFLIDAESQIQGALKSW
jgi:Cu(I)/Ag(I) efflux system membrane fusion protein